MPSPIRPQLSHCGLYVRDVGKMVDFYTNVIGLVLSDRGISSRGGEIAFMTGATQHHHQFVVATGRAPEGVTTVNQVSFKVPDLDALKAVYARVREAGIEKFREVSHGNALSFYFSDPEGNVVEIYMDTPWYVPQPHAVPIDLTRPNDEIAAENDRHCRQTPGCLPLADWQRKIGDRLLTG